MKQVEKIDVDCCTLCPFSGSEVCFAIPDGEEDSIVGFSEDVRENCPLKAKDVLVCLSKG